MTLRRLGRRREHDERPTVTTTTLQKKLGPMLDFFLTEWLDVASLCDRPRYSEHSSDTITDLLAAASDIAADHFEPAQRVSDTEEPYIVGDGAVLPALTHRAWQAYRDFGFLSAVHDEEYGGLQLPETVGMALQVIFDASGVGLVPSMLTSANAALLLSHGTETQKRVFACQEVSGRWTGTMAMSEPQAGSSLADITTRAIPDGADHASDPLGPRYRIFGNKMWISAGEHDLAENIVHLMLAKTAGPDGTVDPSTRGISLFIVPKHLVDTEANLLERNDVTLIGLNHKLGLRATTNTALMMGDGTHRPRGEAGAVGYLVGKPGDGLRQMFHMMNTARTEIGILSASLGFAGYAAALDYARTRRQGRPLGRNGKHATEPQVAIIEHADVKRMLLAQKAFSEGSIALGLYAGWLLDEQKSGSVEAASRAGRLLEILTPIVKSFPSEWCLEANSLAIQVLGGAGYTRDFLVEKYWRDQRLNMIHEGTHGIQGLDLLGRKVRLDDGRYLGELTKAIRSTALKAREAGLSARAEELDAAWTQVLNTTTAAWNTDDPSAALANATPYLQGFGHVVMAWTLLDVAVAATRSTHSEAPGKLAAMEYFFDYELPRSGPWLQVAADKVLLCRDTDPAVL